MAQAVHLHVGTAKSGTTYLQHVMANNRRRLRENGYLYPGDKNSHFMASLSLRDATFKGHRYVAAEGAWGRIAQEVQDFPGQALVSHETLGNATPDVIREAVGSFGDSQVQVLITCRDLGRQLPAAWQERVKNKNQQTFDEYLERVRAAWADGSPAQGSVFWRTQDLVGLARRWADAVGVDNVTLVTVPGAGAAAAPGELWRRFAAAARIPDAPYDLEVRTSNTSLGTVEAELLRRLNGYFPQELRWPDYERFVKHRLVKSQLARHELGGKLSVLEEHQGWTVEAADLLIEGVRAGGYRVVGDLEDLRPTFRADATRPADVTTEQLLDLSLRVLSDLALLKPQRIVRRVVEKAPVPGGREALRILGRALRNRVP